MLRKVPAPCKNSKTHYVTPRETILAAVDAIKIELKDRLAQLQEANKLVEYQRPNNAPSSIWR